MGHWGWLAWGVNLNTGGKEGWIFCLLPPPSTLPLPSDLSQSVVTMFQDSFCFLLRPTSSISQMCVQLLCFLSMMDHISCQEWCCKPLYLSVYLVAAQFDHYLKGVQLHCELYRTPNTVLLFVAYSYCILYAREANQQYSEPLLLLAGNSI